MKSVPTGLLLAQTDKRVCVSSPTINSKEHQMVISSKIVSPSIKPHSNTSNSITLENFKHQRVSSQVSLWLQHRRNQTLVSNLVSNEQFIQYLHSTMSFRTNKQNQQSINETRPSKHTNLSDVETAKQNIDITQLSLAEAAKTPFSTKEGVNSQSFKNTISSYNYTNQQIKVKPFQISNKDVNQDRITVQHQNSISLYNIGSKIEGSFHTNSKSIQSYPDENMSRQPVSFIDQNQVYFPSQKIRKETRKSNKDSKIEEKTHNCHHQSIKSHDTIQDITNSTAKKSNEIIRYNRSKRNNSDQSGDIKNDQKIMGQVKKYTKNIPSPQFNVSKIDFGHIQNSNKFPLKQVYSEPSILKTKQLRSEEASQYFSVISQQNSSRNSVLIFDKASDTLKQRLKRQNSEQTLHLIEKNRTPYQYHFNQRQKYQNIDQPHCHSLFQTSQNQQRNNTQPNYQNEQDEFEVQQLYKNDEPFHLESKSKKIDEKEQNISCDRFSSLQKQNSNNKEPSRRYESQSLGIDKRADIQKKIQGYLDTLFTELQQRETLSLVQLDQIQEIKQNCEGESGKHTILTANNEDCLVKDVEGLTPLRLGKTQKASFFSSNSKLLENIITPSTADGHFLRGGDTELLSPRKVSPYNIASPKVLKLSPLPYFDEEEQSIGILQFQQITGSSQLEHKLDALQNDLSAVIQRCLTLEKHNGQLSSKIQLTTKERDNLQQENTIYRNQIYELSSMNQKQDKLLFRLNQTLRTNRTRVSKLKTAPDESHSMSSEASIAEFLTNRNNNCDKINSSNQHLLTDFSCAESSNYHFLIGKPNTCDGFYQNLYETKTFEIASVSTNSNY